MVLLLNLKAQILITRESAFWLSSRTRSMAQASSLCENGKVVLEPIAIVMRNCSNLWHLLMMQLIPYFVALHDHGMDERSVQLLLLGVPDCHPVSQTAKDSFFPVYKALPASVPFTGRSLPEVSRLHLHVQETFSLPFLSQLMSGHMLLIMNNCVALKNSQWYMMHIHFLLWHMHDLTSYESIMIYKLQFVALQMQLVSAVLLPFISTWPGDISLQIPASLSRTAPMKLRRLGAYCCFSNEACTAVLTECSVKDSSSWLQHLAHGRTILLPLCFRQTAMAVLSSNVVRCASLHKTLQ